MGCARHTVQSPAHLRFISARRTLYSMVDTRLHLDKFMPYRLSVASNAVSGAIARAYRARFGLKIAEWRIIAVLAHAEPLTQLGIAQATEMDKITVSRAVRALMERGLVTRAVGASDARERQVRLSEEGRRLHKEIAPLALEAEARFLNALEPAERDALMRALIKLKHEADKPA